MDNTAHSLATEKIGKLLIRYAVPAIIGTLVMSLYNIIDRIFIGQGVGANAISGLALTFPIMMLSTAFGMLIGAGASARISILLGQKDRLKAEKILGNSLILLFCVASFYTMINMIYMDEILYLFGGTANTIPYAKEFLNIIIPGSILSNLSFSFNNMMRASGYPKKAMYTMLIGALVNVILDPIFIFWLKMGIKGAAIATVISMFITTVFVMWHFLNKNHNICFHRKSFKLEFGIIISIISIGMSPFLINVTASIVNVIMNNSLLKYGGDLAIGAFGIINSFAMLIVMVVIGLCQGMQPIIGYNYGARNYSRMKRTYKLTIKVATVFTTIGFVLAMLLPEYIARAFTIDPKLIKIATNGLQIVFMAFPIVGFQIVTTNFFQSIGKAKQAIFLSLSRQVLFLIPCILIIPKFMQLQGVWIASPTSDVISAILAFFFVYSHRHLLNGTTRKEFKELKHQ